MKDRSKALVTWLKTALGIGLGFRFALSLAGVALGFAVGCQTEPGERVGSETHFLSWCASSGICAQGLECICGTCAVACEEASDCEKVSSAATCSSITAENPSCPNAAVERSCDVPCEAGEDCLVLSAEHRCDRGHCRRLSDECERGLIAPSEVVFLGDNFLASSGLIVPGVQTLAEASGSLALDASYRDFSSTLTTPFGGTMDLSSQLAAAADGGSVRAVILNAGGPDALLNCSEPVTEDCPALQSAVSGFAGLLAEFEQMGVTSVITFFYPDPEDQALKAKFDVLRPLMKEACEGAPLCSFLDLRPTFTGREEEYLLSGGILPTAVGSEVTAELIWSEMGRRCIAQ